MIHHALSSVLYDSCFLVKRALIPIIPRDTIPFPPLQPLSCDFVDFVNSLLLSSKYLCMSVILRQRLHKNSRWKVFLCKLSRGQIITAPRCRRASEGRRSWNVTSQPHASVSVNRGVLEEMHPVFGAALTAFLGQNKTQFTRPIICMHFNVSLLRTILTPKNIFCDVIAVIKFEERLQSMETHILRLFPSSLKLIT